jgi:murein L,D-transpeptidase YafK
MKILLYFFLLTSLLFSDDFLDNQLKYARVRTAQAQKDSIIKELFYQNNLKFPSNHIFIRVFKSEAILELWAKDDRSDKYKKIKTYNICALSGDLGPKRRRGDLQIPEGFYQISDFNPVSNFYLSLKINYPNNSDKILGYKPDLGGDIYIHGDCVTIGCIPLTDEYIKELYWIVVGARSEGQKIIQVHIFPSKLNESEFIRLKNIYKSKPGLIDFWQNLKPGFDYFEKHKKLPLIDILPSGKYIVKDKG